MITWKEVAQNVYWMGAGATLLATAIRYIQRKNRYIEDVPKMKKAMKLILKRLKIAFDWDDDEEE